MGIVHSTMTDEQRKSVAVEYFKSFDRGYTSDGRPFLELFAEDAIVYFPKWGIAHGREEIGRMFGDIGANFKWIRHHSHDFNYIFTGTDTLVIPAYGRGTVWANGTAGPQDFTTEVTSTQPILAERAMYWPTGSSLPAGFEEPASEAADTALEFLAPAGPTPYTLTEGTPGPTTLGTEGDREVVVGKKSPSGGRGPIGTASEPGTTSSSSSGPPWYGSHLSVGRRP